ncbi:MAG: IS1 family transposase [Candidatus Eisenbacteria bacterium]|nr:IS1 family transposase [Candidatus Eisenbacteria bacterium]
MSDSRRTPDDDPDFTPPFCANRLCRFHLEAGPEWRWKRNGIYTRRSDGRQFQLFLCLACRRGFSTRAFCTDYWLRRRDLPAKIADLVSNGTGLRQAARCLKVSHATIGRHVARLGRHCMLFHLERTRDLVIEEAVVVDGFESFEYSQYFPFHLNLAAGQCSWFLYDFTDSPLRRKGRMTAEQKTQREALETELGRPDPRAVEKGMTDLLKSLCRHVPADGRLELASDQHQAYPRAVRQVRLEQKTRAEILHEVTSSKEARTFQNPLFAANLTDLLLRHSHANHRRETIAFSKRRMEAISRASIFQVWRNFVKRRRENGDEQTAAMYLGLVEAPLAWRKVLGQRRFPDRAGLEEWRWTYYRHRVSTQVFADRQRFHELERAF